MRAPRRCSLAVAAIAVLAAGCSSGSKHDARPATSQPTTAARFVTARCPDEVAQVARIRCGRLIVPERRDRATLRTVRLFVTILPRRGNGAPLAPVVVLQGGPGDTPDLASFVDHPLRDGHDVVILDQRGTGRSQRSLACPELSTATYAVLGMDPSEPATNTTLVDAARRCHDRLVGAGIDLQAYNTAESARDVADLRTALHIPEWNLVGNSYGSRLALTVLRDHPAGVRALGLSGVYPPDVNFLDTIGDASADAFDALVAPHPGLRAKFVALLDRLERAPARADATTPSGRRISIVFDGENLVTLLRQGLYQTDLLPVLPGVIEQLAAGRGFDATARIVAEEVEAQVDPAKVSLGAFYSVQCQEDIAARNHRADDAPSTRYPGLDTVTAAGYPYDEICRIWDVGRQPASTRRPVVSNVPVAMFTGALDPATPPQWARAAASHLAHGYPFVLAGYGHDTTAQSCPRAARNAFFANPDRSPDTSCLHEPPGSS